MSSADTPDPIIIETVLRRLEPLDTDKYVIALGPYGRQFFATPNGYTATYLPAKLLSEAFHGRIKKIIWASFGSELESWFFAYKLQDNTSTFEIGAGIPLSLRTWIQQLVGSDLLLTSLRVQLGDNESFVAWSRTAWACANVPHGLQAKLREGSSNSREFQGVTMGSLRNGTLDNVQWHASGSLFIKSGDQYLWKFYTELMRSKWNELWKEQQRKELMRKIRDELAYVVISSHAQVGETFVFIKKQIAGQEAPYIVHFEDESVHTNLEGDSTSTSAPNSGQDEPHRPDQRLQHMIRAPEEAMQFRWATCKKDGKPHARDSWELKLKKGDKVKVIMEMGKDWFVVLDRKERKGWAHGSWLDFENRKLHADARDAYTRFREDVLAGLVPGQLRDFPAMASYVDVCTMEECRPSKEEVSLLGICVHDLLALLQGSGKVSYEWLKEERNVWHPDRFARFCLAECSERLKPMAEQMFVMYGVLMDACNG